MVITPFFSIILNRSLLKEIPLHPRLEVRRFLIPILVYYHNRRLGPFSSRGKVRGSHKRKKIPETNLSATHQKFVDNNMLFGELKI